MSGPAPDTCPTGLDLTAFWKVSYGLYVVTARDGDQRNGCLVNTFVQVAEQPCVVSISLNKKNLTHDIIRRSRKFAVQVLDRDTPLQFLGRFGFRSGREFDKFEGIQWRDGTTGSPVVLDHTIASFEVEVTGSVDCGTHTLFIGNTKVSVNLKPGEPLTYAYYHEVKGGKTGRNAPGYRVFEEHVQESEKGSPTMKKYVCSVCGYVYDPEKGDPADGIEAGTPFESLPDDWVCPVCGASKDQFDPA